MKNTLFLLTVCVALGGCNLFDQSDGPQDKKTSVEDMSAVDMSDATPDLDASTDLDMMPQIDMNKRDISGADMMDLEDMTDLGDMFDMVPDMSVGLCGDGRLDVGEMCDDSGTKDGDGCDSGCDIEDGYVCPVIGQTCAKVTSIGRATKTTLAESSLPSQSSTNQRIACGSDAFVIAVQGDVDTKGDAIGRTSVQCANLTVEANGEVKLGTARSLNAFLDLPDYNAFTSSVCNADTFLSGVTVHYNTPFGEPREIVGLQLTCSKLAIKNGEVTKISSSKPRMMYGVIGDKNYMVDCKTNAIAFGLSADIHSPRTGKILNRFGLQCAELLPMTK